MNKLETIDNNSSKILNSSQKIRKIIDMLFDANSFVETDMYLAGNNYFDGVEALGEGVVCGYATLTGSPVCVIAQNYEVLKGSMSIAHARKIEKTLDRALNTNVPVISIINSDGARLGEGIGVLEGYAKIIKKANLLVGKVPHIAIVNGACVGMMSAYVNTCDFVYMNSKKAFISLNAPQVVIAKEHIVADNIKTFGVDTIGTNSTISTFKFNTEKDLCNQIYKLFDLILPTEEVVDIDDDPNRTSTLLNKNVSVKNLFNALFDSKKFVVLMNDFATDIVCAIGKIGNVTCGVMANDETVNDGNISINGLKKIKNFVNLLDNLDMPLINLVNSKGVECNAKAEQSGLSMLCAEVLNNIQFLEGPKISVITKQAVGFSYLALVSKEMGYNYSVAFCDSYISPINSDTAINIMAVDDLKKAKDPTKARKKLEKTYIENAGNPFIAAKDGYIDNIIEPAVLRPYIISILQLLMGY